MCIPVHHHFICLCPNRNTPTCSHHKYVRNHAEFIVMDEPGHLVDEAGWYYRLRDQGQSSQAWGPYASSWERCIYYRLANRDERTNEVIPSMELHCKHYKDEWIVKPIEKYETGICTECLHMCEDEARKAVKEQERKRKELRAKGIR